MLTLMNMTPAPPPPRADVPTAGIHPTVRTTGDPQSIALTFDDGPNPAVTPQLLRLLARHGVKATFFLIGRHVRANASLAGEIVSAGHSVGNHTLSHVNLMRSSTRTARRELDLCSEEIAAACGARPRLLRPPYGLRRPGLKRIAAAVGLDWIVMWSRHAWDWRPQDHAKVSLRLQAVRGGDVVLLHDGCSRPFRAVGRASAVRGGEVAPPHGGLPEAAPDQSHTVLALAEQLPRWIDQGYRFVTIDQLCR
jgi:peptidoglycan/xylan/chitin deacetylase (PgdA/CDA1 family)